MNKSLANCGSFVQEILIVRFLIYFCIEHLSSYYDEPKFNVLIFLSQFFYSHFKKVQHLLIRSKHIHKKIESQKNHIKRFVSESCYTFDIIHDNVLTL